MRRFLTGVSLGATVVALLAGASAASRSVSSSPMTVLTNGTVLAVAAAGDRIYAGGDFSLIGAYTGSWVAVSAGGEPLAGRPRVDAEVVAAAADGRGGWFLAGNIAAVGSTVRSAKVVHLEASGALDGSWRVVVGGGSVSTLARHGDMLFLGGTFKAIAGKRRVALAAVSTRSGRLLAWHVRGDVRSVEKKRTVPGSVTRLAIGGSTLYVAGYFDLLGGVRRSGLGAVGIGSGRVTRWNPAPNSDVAVIRPSGHTIYLGGDFGRIGGARRNAVAAVDVSTGRSLRFNAEAPEGATIADIAVGHGVVYLAGDFGSFGGRSRHLLASVDARTGALTSWEPNVDGEEVNRIALDESHNTLYVAGALDTVGGQRRDVLAALDTRTGSESAWDPRALGDVRVLVSTGGTVFVGGAIGFVGGSRRPGLAAINPDGTVGDWAPNLQGIVRALAVDPAGGRLYVGGAFAPGDVPAQRNLAVVDVATGALHAFGGGTNSGVWTIAPSPDGARLYIGGAFVTVAGTRRTRLAALDPASGALLPWNSGANDLVRALALADDGLYVGGDFASAGGLARPRLVKLDLATGEALGWSPKPDDNVWALALRDQTLYAGGDFRQIGGRTRNSLGAVDAESGDATSWDPNADDTVRSLRLTRDHERLYAAGRFEHIGGLQRGYAEFAMPQGSLTSWNPSAFDGYAIAFTSGDALVIGGRGGIDIFP